MAGGVSVSFLREGLVVVVTGFHIGARGKAAGRVVRCSAKKGACKLMGADGEPTPHFSSLAEGEAFLAEQESAKRGGFTAGTGGEEAKTPVLTECVDGSGLAVDAAGRWYRDGVPVENMVEAMREGDKPVMFTDGKFHGSIVSDAETDVRIYNGRIDNLINVGCYSEDMNTSTIGGDAHVERAFGVNVDSIEGDAHVGLMTEYMEPGDGEVLYTTSSQVVDLQGNAAIDTVSGETKIVSMMDDTRIGVLTGESSIVDMRGRAKIDAVESNFGVEHMAGSSHVGEVRSHQINAVYSEYGWINDMCDKASVEVVRDYGSVGFVRGSTRVGLVCSNGRAVEVYDNARVDMVESGGMVGCVSGNARVGEVWRGGSVDRVAGRGAAVMSVGSGGRVGAVAGGGVVVDVGSSDVTDACVVESVDASSKVSLLDCGADVTYECGETDVSPSRAREFVVKRLHDDATGIGSACFERAHDGSLGRTHVALRVRDAEGRVVNVPDVDGVLRDLVEVDDDEREMMWERMMGSQGSK